MKGAKTTLRFTRLRLANWRNFLAVDLRLAGRAILVRPNASGKSNLLDALRFLHDVVSVGGGFQAAVERRDGVSKLRCLAARRQPNVETHVSLGSDDAPDQWEYELAFTQDKDLGPVIRRERVVREGREILSRPKKPDLDDPKRLTQTFLEQVNANLEFRQVADFFSSIRYLHLVPQIVRDPDRFPTRADDPFGADLLEQVAATPRKTQEARLRRIRDALKGLFRNFGSWSFGGTVGAPHTCAGSVSTGALERGKPRTSFPTGRFASWAFCGQPSTTRGRCSWKNQSSPCTQTWFDSSRRCWHECSAAAVARSS